MKKQIGIIQEGGLKFDLKLYGHISYFWMVLGMDNHATEWMRSNKFGKRSPSCESPYKVIKDIQDNSYMLETLQGKRLKVAFNGR